MLFLFHQLENYLSKVEMSFKIFIINFCVNDFFNKTLLCALQAFLCVFIQKEKESKKLEEELSKSEVESRVNSLKILTQTEQF